MGRIDAVKQLLPAAGSAILNLVRFFVQNPLFITDIFLGEFIL
jgi:uncharacterized membrane protein